MICACPLGAVLGKREDFSGSDLARRKGSIDITSEAIRALWNQYDALPATTRDKLALPLRWIHESFWGQEPVDRMIAVGVALEALFLDRNIPEQQTYRMSINGSLWLESDSAQRELTAKALTAAYGARSRAVHAAGPVKEAEVRAGRELARRGVLRAVERGFIPEHWTKWILSHFPKATSAT
jgi:hypothetical protein